MTNELQGKKIAFLVANSGVEQIELSKSWDAVKDAGGEPTLIALKGFVEASKPVAAVCHGPWTLVEAGVLGGKTLTSWPSLQTDIRNAGGAWVDAEVFVCPDRGWTLTTSRKPDDLDAFTKAIVEQFSKSSISA